MSRPVIGIPCDIKTVGMLPFHAAGDKYVAAAAGGAGGVPLLIPAIGNSTYWQDLLGILDGVLFPGAVSNVLPHFYGGEPSREGTLHDPARDATTLPLIDLLLQEGIPLLGICRGFQEINVALGGQLVQHVQEEEGLRDHREPDTYNLDEMYASSHRIDFTKDSYLAKWMQSDHAMVNSLHQQGIKKLADTLLVEAIAEDGLIEAYRVDKEGYFGYAVQWHPEWKYWDSPLSTAIFSAFGQACRDCHARKHR